MEEGKEERLSVASPTDSSAESSETSSATNGVIEKPIIQECVQAMEVASEINMLQSDVKRLKNTVQDTDTAIKASETEDEETKTVTENPKTEVKVCESSVNELEITVQETKHPDIKQPKSPVIYSEELAQKSVVDIKDTETIKEQKAHTLPNENTNESSKSMTEISETDLVTKLDVNVEEIDVPTNGTKNVVKEAETEIKDCANIASDSITEVEKSVPHVKDMEKKDIESDEVELKLTDTDSPTEDTRVLYVPSEDEVKISEISKEIEDISMDSDSDFRKDDVRKSVEMMETEVSEGPVTIVNESENEINVPEEDMSCSEDKVQDSAAEDSVTTIECSFDKSAVNDSEMSVDISDLAFDNSTYTTGKELGSENESMQQDEQIESVYKDSETDVENSVTADEGSELQATESKSDSDKIEDKHTTIEDLKIAPKDSESKEVTKTTESEDTQQKLEVSENKTEEAESLTKESDKGTQPKVPTEDNETDSTDLQSKTRETDEKEAKSAVESAGTMITDDQSLPPSSEEEKKLPDIEPVKPEVVESEPKETKVEVTSVKAAIVESESKETISEATSAKAAIVESESKETISEVTSVKAAIVESESKETKSEATSAKAAIAESEPKETRSEATSAKAAIAESEPKETRSEATSVKAAIAESEPKETKSEATSAKPAIAESEPKETKSEATSAKAAIAESEPKETRSEATSVKAAIAESEPKETKSEATSVKAVIAESGPKETKSEATSVKAAIAESEPKETKSEATSVKAVIMENEPLETKSEATSVKAVIAESGPKETKSEATSVKAAIAESEPKETKSEATFVKAAIAESEPKETKSEATSVKAAIAESEPKETKSKATSVKAVIMENEPLETKSEVTSVKDVIEESEPLETKSEVTSVKDVIEESEPLETKSEVTSVKDVMEESEPLETKSEVASVKAVREEQISIEQPPNVSKKDTPAVSEMKTADDEHNTQKDKQEQPAVLSTADLEEESTQAWIEQNEELVSEQKDEDSPKEVEDSGSDETYCSDVSSATPEKYLIQESKCETSGGIGKHFSQATTVDVGDFEDSDPDMFASQSQDEGLDDTVMEQQDAEYRDFVQASHDKGRVIKTSTTLAAEALNTEESKQTSVKRKHKNSDSSDTSECSVPPRKEPRVNVCDTKDEQESSLEMEVLPLSAPERKTVETVRKAGNVAKQVVPTVSPTKVTLSEKEVHISPKADRKRPVDETVSPKIQRKLTFEDEPEAATIARKKLKLDIVESEMPDVNVSKQSPILEIGSPEVEVLEAKYSRKSIEVVYVKPQSSTPAAQIQRLEKIEENKGIKEEEEGNKDELSDSQDLILRLSPSPSQASHISSYKSQESPTVCSPHKSAVEKESSEETSQKESLASNGNCHIETVVEVEEPEAPSLKQNGENCNIIDIEKQEKMKLSENLKRKREETPVIEIHGSDSECDNSKSPEDKKRKTKSSTENGHKDTPEMVPHSVPVHLLKGKEKIHSTPDEGAHFPAIAETSASSIELEHEKDTHEDVLTYLKKVTLDVFLKVEVSKQGNKVIYQGIEQCKVVAEDECPYGPSGFSDLSSGNLGDTSASGSPSSTISGPGPFALQNNRLSIMTTSSSSSGGSSVAYGAARARNVSVSDVGLFNVPLVARVPRTAKEHSFQSDAGVSNKRRMEHLNVIEDVLISLLDIENDLEKRLRSKSIEISTTKEDNKGNAKKSFCDSFTTMNTSPALMDEDIKKSNTEDKYQAEEEKNMQGSEDTPKASKKRFDTRARSSAKTRSKNRRNVDEAADSAGIKTRRKEPQGKEQEKQETETTVPSVAKRSTRTSSNSSFSEDAKDKGTSVGALKRNTRQQSSSDVSDSKAIPKDKQAPSEASKRSSRKRSDSNAIGSVNDTPESKENSAPAAKRSLRKKSGSDVSEVKDDAKQPKAKQISASTTKRSTRSRSDSSVSESSEETKGSRTPSSKQSCLELQENTSSKAVAPFTPRMERKKEKEAAVPQTPEHIPLYTLKEMKPGVAVFAKWTDRKYYSAKLKELQTDGRWLVEFDDGKSKPLLEDYILAVDQLSKGQLVYAMNEEEEYIHGIIKNVEKRGRKENYRVELDEGNPVTVTRKMLFMTEDQAKLLRENTVSTPLKTTPHRLTELTLDNVLEGKRSRNKKNMDSPSESPSTSGVSKKVKAPSTASSESECPSGVECVEGVQRESAGHVVSHRIKGQGTNNPKKNVDDYGPIPKQGSNIFKGKSFILTSSDAVPMMQRHSNSSEEYDSDTMPTTDDSEMDNKIPFSKTYLMQQILAGGGKIYKKFEDIPPQEYKSCFLISNRPNLTAKFILCLANNIPLVSHSWIFASCKTNELANVSHHLLTAGWSIIESKYVEVKKSRRLLHNMKIGLVSESKYFLKFWEAVLKAAGAAVHRIPPEGINKQMKLHTVVSSSSCPFEIQKQVQELGIPIVSTVWIVQCLVNGIKLPFSGHPQFTYEHSLSD